MGAASEAVTRAIEGVTLIFRGYDGLWMIDRVPSPANERGDEELIDLDDQEHLAFGREGCDDEGFERATSVAAEELRGMGADERRSYHARQVRKLGLEARGAASRLLWRLVSDPTGFRP